VPQLDQEQIHRLRPRLVRLAYRLLGTMAEAEDAVQEALLRFHRAAVEVEVAEAFLSRTVTRVCLDVLKSARRKRETYVGPWLPEPIFDAEQAVSDDLTCALMLALESLSPLERAAFLLHDVFGVELGEVAVTLEREPAACRKLATRAREHLRASRPRFKVSAERGAEIAHAFYIASRAGDVAALSRLLAEDVVVYSDGGGKRTAATKPIRSASRVARFYLGLAQKDGACAVADYRPVSIDGLPGFVTRSKDGMPQTTAIDVDGERIIAIYIVRNPDKLARVPLS
jgi:RNA polymerase sigma-70 factor (ECF subfamily)